MYVCMCMVWCADMCMRDYDENTAKYVIIIYNNEGTDVCFFMSAVVLQCQRRV